MFFHMQIPVHNPKCLFVKQYVCSQVKCPMYLNITYMNINMLQKINKHLTANLSPNIGTLHVVTMELRSPGFLTATCPVCMSNSNTAAL